MNLLEVTYQLFLLRPYSDHAGKRLVKTPKLYFNDTGMAAHLSGLDTWEMMEKQAAAGPMRETWVASELCKTLPLLDHRFRLYFWRTQEGQEVEADDVLPPYLDALHLDVVGLLGPVLGMPGDVPRGRRVDEILEQAPQKYKNMVDAWGGWLLFQELLSALDKIAKRHQTKIANVATRLILDKPEVAGVIIGARLGITQHIEQNKETFSLRLDSDDHNLIKEITNQANDLYAVIGDCGSEYR